MNESNKHSGQPGHSHPEHEHEHEDMGCLEAIDALYAYLDGELKDDWSVGQMEFHISHCKSCYSRAEMEKLLTERLRQAGRKSRAEETPDALRHRMRDLMKHL